MTTDKHTGEKLNVAKAGETNPGAAFKNETDPSHDDAMIPKMESPEKINDLETNPGANFEHDPPNEDKSFRH